MEPENDGLIEVEQVGEVEPTPPPADKAAPAAKDPKDEEIAQLRRQVKDSQRAGREFQKTAEFWAGQARREPAAPPAAPKDEEVPAPSVDLVDALTNGDHKSVRKALGEMGFISKKEVEAFVSDSISSTRAQMTREQKIVNDFPELSDEQSPFFKRTGQIYNELAADPTLKGSPRLVELAARMAKAELGGGDDHRSDRRPPRRPVVEYEDDRDLDPDEEIDRQERIARQSGGRGRAPSHRDDNQPEELSTMQSNIVARLRQAGADIDEERYRKRAIAGVRMGGLPTLRRRGGR